MIISGQSEGKHPVILLRTAIKSFIGEEILLDMFRRQEYLGGEQGDAY